MSKKVLVLTLFDDQIQFLQNNHPNFYVKFSHTNFQ